MIIDIFLPLSLIFIMFTLGIWLTIQDFKNIIHQPKSLLLGLMNQIIGPTSDIIENNNHTLLLAMDGINSRDYTVQGVMGLEYGYKDIAYVRFGNRFGHDTAKWSIGGGFDINTDDFSVGLDYAYVNYSILDFTQTNPFGTY